MQETSCFGQEWQNKLKKLCRNVQCATNIKTTIPESPRYHIQFLQERGLKLESIFSISTTQSTSCALTITQSTQRFQKSKHIITALKSMFASHGVPYELFSENGTQLISADIGVTTHSLGGCVPPNIEKMPICPPQYTVENMLNMHSFINPVNRSVSLFLIYFQFISVGKQKCVNSPPPIVNLVVPILWY